MRTVRSVDEVFSLLSAGGAEAYFGEPVTVLEHSLQAAWFVSRKTRNGSERDPLIAAALLHDLGHLLHGEGEDAAAHGLDTRHEELGVAALGDHLPAAVLDPIRLHVAAKRFLCATNAAYLAQLSPASVESLALQGGPMTANEAQAFLAMPHAHEAVVLRRADDAAKVRSLQVPALDAYRKLIESLWR
jgi:phosphonate degradation associated HDIG domain protein